MRVCNLIDSVNINGLEEVEGTLTKITKVKDEATKHKKDKDRGNILLLTFSFLFYWILVTLLCKIKPFF